MEFIETYIFTLKGLGYDEKKIKLLEPYIWGYSCNSSDQKIYAIFSCYLGLVIATVFWNNKVLLVPDSLKDILRFRKSDKKLKDFLIEEINYEIKQIQAQLPNYEDFLSQNIKKLEKRYKDSKKLR